MKLVSGSRLLFLLLTGACLSFGQTDSAQTEPPAPATTAADSTIVYTITVSGTVDPGMAAFIGRAVRVAAEDPDALIVLEMDTFGGRVDAALNIVDTLLGISETPTVAFVKRRAISAGALIALACDRLYMKQGTTIGDVAPIMTSSEGPKELGEKFQSPLRAKFRSLAKKNGYPVALAESMVSMDMVVYRLETADSVFYLDSLAYADLSASEKAEIISRKTVVASGELLTMDDTEAKELGFSRATVRGVAELLEAMDVSPYRIEPIEQSWSEEFVRLVSTIAPLLMLIGFAGLYMEMRTPGFGIPGIVGLICLGLVFFNQYLVGLADYTELLIIGIGLALLGFEIFVTPGFGIMGFGGILLIAIGMVLSFQGFVIPKPEFPWQQELVVRNLIQVLGSFVLSLVLSLAFLRYVFPRIGMVIEGPYLSSSLKESHVDSETRPPVSVGDTGTVLTTLRPSGKMRVGDEVIDVIAEGGFIDKGTEVVVSQISGNRVVVIEKEAA